MGNRVSFLFMLPAKFVKSKTTSLSVQSSAVQTASYFAVAAVTPALFILKVIQLPKYQVMPSSHLNFSCVVCCKQSLTLLFVSSEPARLNKFLSGSSVAALVRVRFAEGQDILAQAQSCHGMVTHLLGQSRLALCCLCFQLRLCACDIVTQSRKYVLCCFAKATWIFWTKNIKSCLPLKLYTLNTHVGVSK